jgi:poly(3-hydroxybutyrate) depolymerase
MSALAVGCGRSALDDGPGETGANVPAKDAASPSPPDAVLARAGCGKPLPSDQPRTIPGTPQGYLHDTVMGTGATLAGAVPANAGPITFWVRVPADYDPNHAYRVVYIGARCDAPGVANVDAFQLYAESQGGSEEAIYVALDTPASGPSTCYDTSGVSSPEWEAFQLIHAVVDQTYCVDEDQVFASGYSGGGSLASMWGCYFAGDGAHPWNGVPGGGAASAPRQFAPRYHLRGQASVAGDDPVDDPPCNGPIAALFVTQPTPGGGGGFTNSRAIARALTMNGCDPGSMAAWHPEVHLLSSCTQYTSCPHGFPVVTCPTLDNQQDDHQIAIAAFTRFFDDVTGGGP